jgi:aminoglycoside 6'-N-acetyltransferase I
MAPSEIAIRRLAPDDAALLERVAVDVFDHPVRPDLVKEFLADPRHHIVVAIDDDVVVGFASGVHFVHPDKPAQMFVNEVGVSGAWQRRGIAARLLSALLAHAREIGCREAWVATEPENAAARALYASSGGIEDPGGFVLYTFPLAR